MFSETLISKETLITEICKDTVQSAFINSAQIVSCGKH